MQNKPEWAKKGRRKIEDRRDRRNRAKSPESEKQNTLAWQSTPIDENMSIAIP